MERVPRDRRSLDILSVKKEAKLSASEVNDVQVVCRLQTNLTNESYKRHSSKL